MRIALTPPSRIPFHAALCLPRLNNSRSTTPHQSAAASSLRMAAPPNGVTTPADEAATPRKLTILMLHGYTQNGPLFHAKTRALEKLLHKAFPPSSKPTRPPNPFPGGIQLIYPTAPIRLRPADIPGFETTKGAEDGGADVEPDAWGWWKREVSTGRYVGVEEGLAAIADAIRGAGGIDGVIGFSQGAAAAALVASLMEEGRAEEGFERAGREVEGAMAFPESWTGLQDRPLRFAVAYSGFVSPNPVYRGFYEPRIRTPMLHFIGSLDSVVEESRSLALVEVCDGQAGRSRTVYHPGGHFVPIGKDMAGVLVAFLRETCQDQAKEESLEDMDLPF